MPKITLKRKKQKEASPECEEVHNIEDDDDEIQFIATKKIRDGSSSNKEESPGYSTRTTRIPKSKQVENKIKSTPALPPAAGPATTAVGKGRMNLQKLEAMARATTKLKEDFSKAQSSSQCLPWVDRNFPKNLDEHFVHKKKVSDLRVWLQNSLAPSNSQPRICLLTGPTGSGKTATAYLLANELECSVKEWIQPMSLTQYQAERSQPEEIYGRSQTDLFSDFLLRSSQYSALPMKGKKNFHNQIVLVEDIPNMFYRDTEAFHNILRNFQSSASSSVIFILADNASGAFNPIKLFTARIVQELRITQITFNAVAPTLMVKFLALVCSRENVAVQQGILEGVAAASGGDIRCAINTLQFKILQEKPQSKDGAFKRPVQKLAKFKRDKMFKNDELTHKDDSLFLFRALGKVLYNKRCRTNFSTIEDQLHENLKDERRTYCTEDNPEDIAQKIEVSTDTFVGFLSQNYLNFFSSVEEVSKAANYLADAQYLLSRWNYEDSSYGSNSFKNQDRKEQLALSISIRGLMHSNVTPKSSQWRPLRKPLCGDIDFKTRQIVDRTRDLFPTLYSFVEGFYYEDMPFLSKMPKTDILNPAQRKLIEEVGILRDLKGTNKSKWTETLDEKFADVEDTKSSDDEVPAVPVTPEGNHIIEIKTIEANVEIEDGTPDDFLIEEFED